MGTVTFLIQLSLGGLLNLNVAEHRLKMTPELDSQSKRPLTIVAMLSKSWWWAIDDWNPGGNHGSEHFIWQRLEYFAWTFGFKQGPCQMGPMFSDTHSEVISGGNMFGAVGYLQCNPGQRVVPYNNWWWNVDSPLGLRHRPGVDAVETRQLSCRPAPRKFRTQRRLESRATIFWYYKGLLLVDYLPHFCGR